METSTNRSKPAARVRPQTPLKFRMSRILPRRKKQIPQQEFASVWQVLGLVEEEDWCGSGQINSCFVFLYAVDFTEIGLEGQLTRDAPVRILAVRAPVSQCPSPVEQHRISANLRDYLRSQLAASPLMRHFILVLRDQPLWKSRNKSSSLLGRGQYVAVINAATQVNGMTPLEVRLVQEQEGGRQLTASPSGRTVGGFSASMASRLSRSVDVTHHLQLQQTHAAPSAAHGTLANAQTAAQQQQQFTPRMSMRRGMTNSVASNLNG